MGFNSCPHLSIKFFAFFFIDTIDLQLFYDMEREGPEEIGEKSEAIEPPTGPVHSSGSHLKWFAIFSCQWPEAGFDLLNSHPTNFGDSLAQWFFLHNWGLHASLFLNKRSILLISTTKLTRWSLII